MKPIRWHHDKDGRLTESALRAKLERLGYSVTRYVYPVGTVFPNHSHGVDKIDAVVSGRFKMIAEGQELVREAGDILPVARGIVHSAEVLGDEPVVSLDGVAL
jgi:quercetin dioxygenase-like cupin family protein